MNSRSIQLRSITAVGLMSAAVFASNYIQFMIPTPFGPTRIHIANGICLLAALLFGGVKGGTASGFGSFLYDLTFPAYVATSWVTLIMKFLMAFLCGIITHGVKNESSEKFPPVWRRLTGIISGAFSYVLMYIVKQFVEQCLFYGIAFKAVAVSVFTVNLPVSLLNAVLAVFISLILYSALLPAIHKTGLAEKFGVK